MADGKEAGSASWWPAIILGLVGLLTLGLGIGVFILLAAVVTSPPVHTRFVKRAAGRGKTYGRKQAVLLSLAMIVGLPLLLMLAVLPFASQVAPTSASPSSKSGGEQARPTNPSTAIAQPPKVRSAWRYNTSDDPMGGIEKTACIKSEDDIQQGFPYRNTNVLLCLRQSSRGGLDVYARLVQGGQILCSSSVRCNINVRFDQQAAQPWPGVEAGDMSKDVVFLEREEKIVSALKTAKEFRLELEIYQQGVQTVTFKTDGLQWE